MDDLIKQQLDEMSELINSATEAPVTETVVTDPPGTEAPGTDAPATDSPATTAPVTDAPDDSDSDDSDQTPVTSPPADELTTLKAELAELRALLKSKDQDQDSPAEPPPPPPPPTEENFLEGVDLDDLTSDPEEFNKLLNKIYRKATEVAEERISNFQARLPEYIGPNLELINNLRHETEKFYTENSDLAPFKKVVSIVFEELSPNLAEKPLAEQLKEVATETRKRLNLPLQPKKTTQDAPPRLPKKNSQPRPKQPPKPDPFQAEIEAMEKALNY